MRKLVRREGCKLSQSLVSLQSIVLPNAIELCLAVGPQMQKTLMDLVFILQRNRTASVRISSFIVSQKSYLVYVSKKGMIGLLTLLKIRNFVSNVCNGRWFCVRFVKQVFFESFLGVDVMYILCFTTFSRLIRAGET